MSILTSSDSADPLRLTGQARQHGFVSVTSERVALFGTESGVFELWTWPLKIAHDWRSALFDAHTGTQLLALDRDADAAAWTRPAWVTASPFELEITQTWGEFLLVQTVFASRHDSALVFHYHVEGPRPVELEISFLCDLRPMWPAGLGGQIFGRDKETGGFIATEELGRFATWVGGPDTRLVEPAQRAGPVERVRFRLALTPGAPAQPFYVAAARKRSEPLPRQAHLGRGERVTGPERAAHVVDLARRLAQSLPDSAAELRDESLAHWRSHLRETTALDCDSTPLARSFLWSKIAIERAWVDVPEVGRGIVAGFGASGNDERPGRAWFFEADMLGAARALALIGDFEGARTALQSVAQHQRADGRLPSQRSLAAGLCRWLEDYPYAHLEALSTLSFGSALGLYRSASGDASGTRALFETVERAVVWTVGCVDGDGLVRTERAGLGGISSGLERERISADLTLQASWVANLRAVSELARELGRAEFSRLVHKELADAEAGLATLWREEAGRYEFGWLDTGLRTRTPSGFAAAALATGAGPAQRREQHARQLNAPELATDWGLRGFAPSFPWFDPERDDLGAVRFELTARAACVLYRAGLAMAGEQLLHTCLAVFGLASRGAAPRALRGDRAQLASPEVACDVAAASAWIETLLAGVLGIEVDALENEVAICPAYPLPATRFALENVGTRSARTRVEINTEEPRGDAPRALSIQLSQQSGPPLLGRLGCLLPPGSELVRVTAGLPGRGPQRQLPARTSRGPNDTLRVEVEIGTTSARFEFRCGPWVSMPRPAPVDGQPSCTPRWIAGERLSNSAGAGVGLCWNLAAPPGSRLELPFTCDIPVEVQGAELREAEPRSSARPLEDSQAGSARQLVVVFPDEGEPDGGFVLRRVELRCARL